MLGKSHEEAMTKPLYETVNRFHSKTIPPLFYLMWQLIFKGFMSLAICNATFKLHRLQYTARLARA